MKKKQKRKKSSPSLKRGAMVEDVNTKELYMYVNRIRNESWVLALDGSGYPSKLEKVLTSSLTSPSAGNEYSFGSVNIS